MGTNTFATLELVAILCAKAHYRKQRLELCITDINICKRLKAMFGGTWHFNRVRSFNYRLQAKKSIKQIQEIIEVHYPTFTEILFPTKESDEQE